MVKKRGQLKTKKTGNFLASNWQNRKGQLKIQQMAFVLIAVTLFFVIVGLFVLTISFSGIKESADILKEENALVLVSRLADSPEFSCGNVFEETNINCVDADKLIALKNNLGGYSNFWDVEGIKVRKIYPESGSETECHGGNYLECNVITLISSDEGTGVSNFVSLCRKNLDTEINLIPDGCGDDSEVECEEVEEKRFQDKCELAKIIITYKT